MCQSNKNNISYTLCIAACSGKGVPVPQAHFSLAQVVPVMQAHVSIRAHFLSKYFTRNCVPVKLVQSSVLHLPKSSLNKPPDVFGPSTIHTWSARIQISGNNCFSHSPPLCAPPENNHPNNMKHQFILSLQGTYFLSNWEGAAARAKPRDMQETITLLLIMVTLPHRTINRGSAPILHPCTRSVVPILWPTC